MRFDRAGSRGHFHLSTVEGKSRAQGESMALTNVRWDSPSARPSSSLALDRSARRDRSIRSTTFLRCSSSELTSWLLHPRIGLRCSRHGRIQTFRCPCRPQWEQPSSPHPEGHHCSAFQYSGSRFERLKTVARTALFREPAGRCRPRSTGDRFRVGSIYMPPSAERHTVGAPLVTAAHPGIDRQATTPIAQTTTCL